MTKYLEAEKVTVLPHPVFFRFSLVRLFSKFYLSGKKYQSQNALGSAIDKYMMDVWQLFPEVDWSSKEVYPGQWWVLWRAGKDQVLIYVRESSQVSIFWNNSRILIWWQQSFFNWPVPDLQENIGMAFNVTLACLLVCFHCNVTKDPAIRIYQ